MIKKFQLLNTLPKKLMCAIALWLLGAVFFMAITLKITWNLEDRGIAINEAGSLRKQTYLIVNLVQTQQTQRLDQELNTFHNKLTNLSHLETHILNIGIHDLNQKNELDTVKTKFLEFKSDLKAYQTTSSYHSPQLLIDAERFITHIDTLVKSIEEENTRSIQMMRLVQLLLMVMAFVSAFLSMTLLNKLVLAPLSLLNKGLEEIKKGNLSSRLNIQTNDEFQMVSDGFNQMAFSLRDLYLNLEEKVIQKTKDLEHTSQELAMLYDITSLFHKTQLSEETLNTFLEKVIKLAMTDAGSIRIFNQQGRLMDTIISINLPTELLENPDCTKAYNCLCGQVSNEPISIIRLNDETEKEKTQLVCSQLGLEQLAVYKIQSPQKNLGILTLYYNKRNKNHPDISGKPLIKLLCDQLAVAIENNRLVLKEKQYAVLEERNIMAQGLHDSIAQSLSFLNLQLQMLKQALNHKDEHKVEQHLAFLDTGIQECYDDVRELLHNFRLKLTNEPFQEALSSVINRFKAQISIPVKFSFISTGPDLTPQQQLQLIFIVQEALSNIRKHSKATLVYIQFSNEHAIHLSIEDNGIGFETALNKEERGHHIGLSIMQERIAQVNGKISISSKPAHGTKINVVIDQHHR